MTEGPGYDARFQRASTPTGLGVASKRATTNIQPLRGCAHWVGCCRQTGYLEQSTPTGLGCSWQTGRYYKHSTLRGWGHNSGVRLPAPRAAGSDGLIDSPKDGRGHWQGSRLFRPGVARRTLARFQTRGAGYLCQPLKFGTFTDDQTRRAPSTGKCKRCRKTLCRKCGIVATRLALLAHRLLPSRFAGPY